MKTKALLLFLFIFLLNLTSQGQEIILSENAEISILTIGPGQTLQDTFGHNAFRVKDKANSLDSIFNYGTFDFNTPNFYIKFARGKLLYSLSVGQYDEFERYYIYYNRYIDEQVLDLTHAQKTELLRFLLNNAQIENKDYKYDFFYDNCATRIRDVISEATQAKISFKSDFVEQPRTFRQLIQQNVSANSWGSLGMDLAIGAVTDRKAEAWEYQFLPDYVFKATSSATITDEQGERPLVKKTNKLFINKPSKPKQNFFTSPLFLFSILALVVLFVTYRDYKKKKRSRFMDVTIFFLTGLIGIFILLLWFATDHSATANNYNILWAFPLSLVFTYGIGKKQPKIWLRRYIMFLLVLMVLLTLHSITGVQQFAITLIPLFIALAIRYIYLLGFLKK